jgi:hypothetical protein
VDVVEDVVGAVDEVPRVQPRRRLERRGAPVAVAHCLNHAPILGRWRSGGGWGRPKGTSAAGARSTVSKKIEMGRGSRSLAIFFLFLR